MKEHTVTGSTVQDKNIVWEGLAMVQWQNADGTAQKNLFAQGEQTLSTGETLIYITDHLGSVRGWQRLSDGARGEADYSAYGTRTITSNATGVPVRSFTGHYQHEASGLLLAPYRAFDPDLGRWLSEDPIAEAGGLNLYGYVGNGPVGGVDPLGLAAAPFFSPYAPTIGAAESILMGALSGAIVARAPGPDDQASNDITGPTPFDAVGLIRGACAMAKAGAGFAKALSSGTAKAAIGATGKIGEDALAGLGGTKQKFFNTTLGRRFVDRFVDGIANEAKVGYQSLTPEIRLQVMKDVELMQTNKIQGAIWNFYRSPVTGKIGPSGPLGEFLNQNGIPFILHY